MSSADGSAGQPGPVGPTVALYGHRLGRSAGTGISVYVRELIPAIAAEAAGGRYRYCMGGSPEPADDPPPKVGLPLGRAPGPRKLLHAIWTEVGLPKADRFLGHPDLIHVLYPSCPVPSRAPIVYTVHDLMPLTNPEWFDARERRMFHRAVGDAARRAIALIADSTSIADQLQDGLGVNPGRIHVVPLGASGAFAQPHTHDEVSAVCKRHGVVPGRYAVMVGAVSVRKNPGPVIAALAGYGDLKLVMIGPPGAGADQVEADIRRRHLSDRVNMTGWLPREELTALLSGAVALVHPSLDEGFGMTPLEAMAAGIPAVVSDAGALPETVGDAALVVAAGDPEAWGRALERVVGDEPLRTRLVDNGLARAAQFTWAATARGTIAVYDRCLSRG